MVGVEGFDFVVFLIGEGCSIEDLKDLERGCGFVLVARGVVEVLDGVFFVGGIMVDDDADDEEDGYGTNDSGEDAEEKGFDVRILDSVFCSFFPSTLLRINSL